VSADSPIVSRPFHPKMCCERCTFNSGLHADWCPKRWQFVEGSANNFTIIDWNQWLDVPMRVDPSTASDYGIQWDGDTYTISEIFRVANPGSEATVHNLTIPKALMDQVKRGKLIEE